QCHLVTRRSSPAGPAASLRAASANRADRSRHDRAARLGRGRIEDLDQEVGSGIGEVDAGGPAGTGDREAAIRNLLYVLALSLRCLCHRAIRVWRGIGPDGQEVWTVVSDVYAGGKVTDVDVTAARLRQLVAVA